MPARPTSAQLSRTNTSTTDDRLVAAAVTFSLSDGSVSASSSVNSTLGGTSGGVGDLAGAGRLPVISESHFAELMSGQRQRQETSAGGRIGPAVANNTPNIGSVREAESAREEGRLISVGMIREDTTGVDAPEASTSFAAARDSLEIQSERSARAASVAGTALEHQHSSRVLTDEADASRHDNASQHSDEEEEEEGNEESYLDTAADQTAATEQGEYSIYLPTEPSSIAEICRFDVGLEGGLPHASPAPSGIKLALQALKKRPADEAEGNERAGKRARRRNPYDEPVPPPSSMREQKRMEGMAELHRPDSALMRLLHAERKVCVMAAGARDLHSSRAGAAQSNVHKPHTDTAGRRGSSSARNVNAYNSETLLARGVSGFFDAAPDKNIAQRILWHAALGTGDMTLTSPQNTKTIKASMDTLKRLCGRAEGREWLYR